MRSVYRTALFGLTLCVSSVCAAQSPQPAAPSHPTAKRSQGVIDYALGKINPGNKDFGDSAANARSEVVGATIQNLYFWSNVVSLTLLAGASAGLMLVLRTQDKREIVAANLISQLWNGRVVDRKEIVRRTGLYNALVEAKNSTLTAASPVVEEEHRDVPISDGTIRTQPGQKSRVQSKTAAPKSPSSTGETGTLPPGELAEKAIFLEGQNQALRNSERNLRDRLNQVSLDLEQERRRNQTLKGA
jgi:hypothetical protein